MNNYCVFITDWDKGERLGFIRLNTTDKAEAIKVVNGLKAVMPAHLYIDYSNADWTAKDNIV